MFPADGRFGEIQRAFSETRQMAKNAIDAIRPKITPGFHPGPTPRITNACAIDSLTTSGQAAHRSTKPVVRGPSSSQETPRVNLAAAQGANRLR